MVSALELVPVALILVVNTALAAVVTRLARVRMETAWGAAALVALVVPMAATVVTIAVGSLAGPSLGSRALVVGLFVVVPIAVGVTIDVFWMPAPDEVELPATVED